MPPKKKTKPGAKGGAAKPKAKPKSKPTANKPTASKSSSHAASASHKTEMPLAERSEDAQEVREIKDKRDKLIARKPNDPKHAEACHMACSGLYKCYKHGERSVCLKAIHDKLDKIEKSL